MPTKIKLNQRLVLCPVTPWHPLTNGLVLYNLGAGVQGIISFIQVKITCSRMMKLVGWKRSQVKFKTLNTVNSILLGNIHLWRAVPLIYAAYHLTKNKNKNYKSWKSKPKYLWFHCLLDRWPSYSNPYEILDKTRVIYICRASWYNLKGCPKIFHRDKRKKVLHYY